VPKKLAGRRPFRKNETVRAIEAAWVATDDGEFFVRTGMEFPADHAVVKAIPQSFMPSDTPADEVVNWLPQPPEPIDHPDVYRHPEPEPIPDERKVVCVHALSLGLTRFLKVGAILDARDPIVAQQPSCFVKYAPLTLEDVEALVGRGT
jgi:hypothetical protein